MKHSRKNGTLPENNQDHFRTPRKPSTPATHLLSRSTTLNTAPSPVISTPSTARKGNPLPPIRSQSTLTQIDFIPQPTNAEIDQLDYMAEEHHDGAQKRQKSALLDDGSESETDYRPPLRTRANFSRFESNNDHPKRRRKSNMTPNRILGQGQSLQRGQTPKAGGTGKGKRKLMEKPSGKRDKTLTQMDFVRRYIPIEDSDDNDVNMTYIQPPPHLSIEKDEAREEKTSAMSTSAVKSEPTVSSKRNRRILEHEIDLSTGETITSGESQNTNMLNTRKYVPPSKPPSTPQKHRKLEIPSSQSPESPGLAIITSSQFKTATGSPVKRIPLGFGLQEELVKQESQPASLIAGDSQGHENASQIRSQARLSSIQEEAAYQEQSIPADIAEKVNSHVEEPDYVERSSEDQGWKPQRSQRQRTVVYETDAESSASEFEHAESESLNPANEEVFRERVSHLVDDGPGLPSDDSQEPPLPETQPPEDLGFDPPSEPPMSDVSAYYQRVQPATQFPLEPVPALNTQKLHELFPNDDNTQSPRHRPEPVHSPQKFQGPFLQSQSQSQSQRENPEQDHTEVVPESSPMREQQDHMDEPDDSVFQRPPAPGSIVQVESSQPVRRGDSGPGNMLSRSQLLTSSVMESIALPNFWAGSQDSVGEPYSLPEH